MNKKAILTIILGACFMQPQVFGQKFGIEEQITLTKNFEFKRWSAITQAIQTYGLTAVKNFVTKKKLEAAWNTYLNKLPTDLSSQVKESLLTALSTDQWNTIQDAIANVGLDRVQTFAQSQFPNKWQQFVTLYAPGAPPKPAPGPAPKPTPGPPPPPPRGAPTAPPTPPRPADLASLKKLNQQAIDMLKEISDKLKKSGLDITVQREFAQQWLQAANDFASAIG